MQILQTQKNSSSEEEKKAQIKVLTIPRYSQLYTDQNRVVQNAKKFN
jgi:hypothetical protein